MKKQELLDYIEGLEETRFENFKIQLGLPYDDEEAWIEYIKKLQDINAERLNDCNKFMELLKQQQLQLKLFIEGSSR
jgi:hypothetical protein